MLAAHLCRVAAAPLGYVRFPTSRRSSSRRQARVQEVASSNLAAPIGTIRTASISSCLTANRVRWIRPIWREALGAPPPTGWSDGEDDYQGQKPDDDRGRLERDRVVAVGQRTVEPIRPHGELLLVFGAQQEGGFGLS